MVNGISGDAEHGLLLYQRYIISSSPIAGGHGGRYCVRSCVPGINTMVLIDEGLVPVLLSPERAGSVLCHFHDTAALVVET